MYQLASFFSTRELALLIWITLFVGAMSASTNLRQSMLDMLRSIFATKIGGILLIMIVYVGLVVCMLSGVGLFNYSLVKDLIFWFFSFAIVSFFTINKANTNSYFKGILIDCFRWTLFVEFLVNFYTFSFLAEVILLPILGLFFLVHAYAQTNKEHAATTNVLTNILSVIGWGYFFFALYKTITDYKALFSMPTLFSFLLPVLLTILLIPFLYLVAVYMSYELLFIRLERMDYREVTANKLKWEVFKVAGINLSNINLIDKGINKIDLYEARDVISYIRTLV